MARRRPHPAPCALPAAAAAATREEGGATAARAVSYLLSSGTGTHSSPSRAEAQVLGGHSGPKLG
jgi:hypothetical protein